MESSPYHFDSSLIKNPEWKDEKRYKYLELDATKHETEYNRIAALLQKSAPNFVIEKITLIWNTGLTRMFEEQIEIFSSRSSKPAFQPSWDKENNPQLRKKVIEKLKKQTVTETGVPLLPVWHGTNPSTVNDICSDGFAALQLTDSGFFGKGLYFSTSAEYCARVYAKEASGKRQLVLCWTCFGNIYPVIDGDKDKLQGKGNYKNYDTHYVPVRPRNPLNPNEAVYLPCADVHLPVYEEIVVFGSSQVIPRAIVEGRLIDVQLFQKTEEVRAREVVDSPIEMSKEFQSPDKINILVWGLSQAGKSSLVNGLINLFRPKKPLTQYAYVQPNDTVITQSYTPYEVPTLIDDGDEALKRGLNLTIWDSWGWNGPNHNKKMIPVKYLIEGRVRPGTDFKEKSAILDTPDPTLKCHAVIVAVTPGMVALDYDLREYVKEIIDSGLSPIFVITNLSEFETENGKNTCYNEYIQVTGLTPDRVFFFDNYYEQENQRSQEKDSIYARILMKAYSDAFKLART